MKGTLHGDGPCAKAKDITGRQERGMKGTQHNDVPCAKIRITNASWFHAANLHTVTLAGSLRDAC